MDIAEKAYIKILERNAQKKLNEHLPATRFLEKIPDIPSGLDRESNVGFDDRWRNLNKRVLELEPLKRSNAIRRPRFFA